MSDYSSYSSTSYFGHAVVTKFIGGNIKISYIKNKKESLSLSSDGDTHWVTPFKWELPSSVAEVFAQFHHQWPVSSFSWKCFMITASERYVSDTTPSTEAADLSKEYQQLSLPIFTLLMAIKTGSGSCWYLGTEDRETAGQLCGGDISALHRLIWSALWTGCFGAVFVVHPDVWLALLDVSPQAGSVAVNHHVVENFLRLHNCQKPPNSLIS